MDSVITHRQISFLRFVLNSPRKRLVAILSKNKQLLNHISDILLNILLLNIRVKSDIINKLKRHKRIIYQIVNKTTSDKSRLELLLKHSAIIKLITPLLKPIEKTLKNEPLYENVFNQRRR